MESTNPLPTVELSVTPSSLGKRSVLRIVVIIVFIVLFVDFERAEDVRNLNAGPERIAPLSRRADRLHEKPGQAGPRE